MKLHDNKELLLEIMKNTSEYFGINYALVEKDYYITLLLEKLVERIDGLLFKGGTCLAKCYKIIDRFSEDIDLTLDYLHFTQSKKREANKRVIEVCDELGFTILNRESVEKHSHGNYNCYNIAYPIDAPNVNILPFIKIEMVFIQKAYPDDLQSANSYIGEYILSSENKELAEEYGLLPFKINTQALERTLVDKVFAICDYYLKKEEIRNSRHVYDIYCLLKKVKLNDDLKTLIKSVREDRQKHDSCPSSFDGVNINSLLQEIIDTSFYKFDYHTSTIQLLIKPISYETAITSINEIIESKVFI